MPIDVTDSGITGPAFQIADHHDVPAVIEASNLPLLPGTLDCADGNGRDGAGLTVEGQLP